MKKNIIFLLLFSCSLVIAQNDNSSMANQVDSLLIDIDNTLKQYTYSAPEDLQRLYSIGFNLPRGIYTSNTTLTEDDYNKARTTRTKLYILWVSKMIESGLNVNYDPAASENESFNDSSVFLLAEGSEQEKAYEEWKVRNAEKSRKRHQYLVYTRIMNKFRCFYKYSFTTHGKDFSLLEKLIKESVLDSDLNSEELIEVFKIELQKSTCDL